MLVAPPRFEAQNSRWFSAYPFMGFSMSRDAMDRMTRSVAAFITAATFFVVLKSCAGAEPESDPYRSFAIRSKAGKTEFIKRAREVRDRGTKIMAAIKAGRVKAGWKGPQYDERTARYTFATRKERDEAVAKCRDDIDELNKLIDDYATSDRLPPAMIDTPLQIGSVGTVSSATIVQVLDAGAFLGQIEGKDAWIVAPTKGMVDDSQVDLDGIFEINGTKSYDTEFGQRTVFLLTPVDAAKLQPYLDDVLKERKR